MKNTRTFAEKAMAALLAVSMLFSMMPLSVVATDEVANDAQTEATVYPTVVNLNNGDATENLNLSTTPGLATYTGGCGFEVATASGATNARYLTAYESYIDLQVTKNNMARAVLKVKVPAGTYRVFMKVPAVSKNPNAGKLSFTIGGAIGTKAYQYTGGTQLGTYDFSADGALGTVHVFENTVTLTGDEHQLDITNNYIEEYANGTWTWGTIESLYFVPVDIVNVGFSNDAAGVYSAWQSLGGPISAEWAGNYVNQLSYGTTGTEWAASAGTVVQWATNTDTFSFKYTVATPTTISYNILVPEDGTYKVEFTAGARHKDYGKIYLDISGNALGYYDFSDNSASNPATKKMSIVGLTAGIHTLTVSTNETGANNTYTGAAVFPKAVKLTRLSDAEVAEQFDFIASLAEKIEFIDDSSQIDIVGNGIYIDKSKVVVSYATGSGTDDVLSITEDGVVTAVGVGTETIKVSAKYLIGHDSETEEPIYTDIVEYTIEAITVNEQPDYVEAKFSNDPDGVYSAWQSLGGPISEQWAANYVNQLSYKATGTEWAASTGKVVAWDTNSEYFSFLYDVGTKTTITYNIEVPQTGTYKVDFIAGARDKNYGKIYLDVNGDALGYYDFSDTADTNLLTKRMSNVYLEKGIRTITLTVDDAGKNSSGTRLTVCPKAVNLKLLKAEEPVFEYDFEVGFSEKPRYTGDSSQIEIIGNGVYLDEDKLEVTYSTGSGNNDVFTISTDGVVTAVGAGTDTIKVSTLYEGNTEAVESELQAVTVAERPAQGTYTIDFAKGVEGQNLLQNIVNIDEHGWEVVMSESTSFLSDPRYFREIDGYLYLRMVGATEKLTIRTYVPSAGTYDVDLKSGNRAPESGDWAVYVDDTKVGEYSFRATGADVGSGQTMRIGRVDFDKPGYKKITFQRINADPAGPGNNANFALDELRFVPYADADVDFAIGTVTDIKYVGQNVDIKTVAKIGDVEISPLLLGLEYVSSNPEVVTVAADGSGGITAAGEGFAVITVSGSYYGHLLSDTIECEISAMPSYGETLTVTFGDNPEVEGEINDGLYAPNLAVSVPASIEKHGWEVDPDSNTTTSWYYREDHLHIRPLLGGVIAFKVYIPIDGYYRFDLTTYKKGAGSATVTATVDDEYVGEATCNSMYEEESGETIHMNAVKLNSGYHVIKFIATDIGTGAHFFLKEFALTALAGKPVLERVDCSIDKTTLYPGEKVGFSAEAIITGETAYFFEEGTADSMTYSSEDEDVVTVTPDGTVFAVAPGSTKIVATAVIDGETKSGEVEVVVADNYIKTATASLSRSELFPDEKPDEADEYEYMSKAQIEVKLFLEDDTEASLEFAEVELTPVNGKISIDEDWVLTALEFGESGFTITASLGGKTVENIYVPVTVSQRALELEYVDLQADKTTIKVGESVNVIAQGMRFNGEITPAEELEVFYDVQDEKVLRIDNDGVVTGLSTGSTNVVVHMKKEPFMRSAALLITVEDSLPPEKVYIKSPEYIYEGISQKLVTVAELPGGVKTTVADDAVTYNIVPSQSEGAVEITGDGYISGISAGSVQIKANVAMGGVTLSSEAFTVTVRESIVDHSIIYDFSKYYPKYEDVDPNDIKIEDEGWEINKALTSDHVETVRALYPLRCCFGGSGFSTLVQALDTPIESDLAIDFKVGEGEAGTYSFNFVGNKNISGGLFAIYIDGEYMGKYDFDQRNQGGTTFNCVNLQEGVHTIVFRAITGSKSDENYHYIIVGSMRFYRISTGDSFAELKVEMSNPGTMSVGETCRVEASAIMADGRPFAFDPSDLWESKSSISISSDNPEILSVDESTGVVTAVSQGTANVVVTATVHGYPPKTVTKEITVDDSGIAKLSAQVPEISVGETVMPSFVVETDKGRIMDNQAIEFNVINIDNSGIVSVAADGISLIGKGEGSATVTYTATLNNCSAEYVLPVTVKRATVDTITVTAPSYVMRPGGEGIQLVVTGKSSEGIELDLTDSVTYSSKNSQVLNVSETGFVTPVGEIGETTVEVTATFDGKTIVETVNISVRNGKIASTYYSADRVAAARENIELYGWANAERTAAVQQADKYLENLDFIYDNITTNELPRTSIMGHRDDPNLYNCKYCGEYWYDVQYNTGAPIMDQINSPWKVQCDICRRKFPSNDFWSFYQTGIDENGNWSYEKAKANGSHLLTNDLYPEMGEGWGVDDGYGYRTGNMITKYIADKNSYKTFEEIHYYIAFYNMHIFSSSANGGGLLQNAVTSLRDAYVYTGEKKYGRAGAILTDRFADVYPDMDLQPYAAAIGNGVVQARGKLSGMITDPQTSENYVKAYDAFFDMYDDPYVVNYLSQRAGEMNLENDKSTPEKIRKNCEDGILRGVYNGCYEGKLWSNFGRVISALSLAALVLDDEQESGAWLEWMNKDTGDLPFPYESGGELTTKLVSSVDRDGYGDEGSVAYTLAWGWALGGASEYLQLYNEINPLADKYNLYKNSRYRKMLLANLPTFLCGTQSPQIGDSGQTATVTKSFSTIICECLLDFFKYTKDPAMAQAIYLQSYENVDDLRYDIFTRNPESAGDDILEKIKEYGEYDAVKSRSLNGFGFSILRDGSPDEAADNMHTNQRNFWIGAIRGYGHRHPDRLNLGIEAYGLNMAPDLGYTRNSSGDEYSYWGHSTLSHNTVIVNEISQSDSSEPGKVLHFDYGGDVQVMDIDASHVYPMTEEYRRSVVMINVDDTVSYGIDFFRIRGGDDHLYSFHSQSDEVEFDEYVQGKLVAQPMGSYEGPDVAWATSPTTTSYSWLDHVRRAKSPQTGEFSADFKVKDFRNNLGNGVETDLHLRMTMVNDFDLDEITVAHGYPSQYRNNPKMFEWVLARRKGENLDTLFTTVFEPYKADRYIESIENISVKRIGGAAEGVTDTVKAVKVTFKDKKRIDYVVYATNDKVEYRVGDVFDFAGFVGVYTTDAEGNLIRAYAHDASKIGEITGESAITAKVIDFTQDLAIQNSITISCDVEDVNDLIGKYIFIENDGMSNAAYDILDAKRVGDNVVLDIGDISTVRSLKDNKNISAGYIYDFKVGANAEIRTTLNYDSSLKTSFASDDRVASGSRYTKTVSAQSDKKITYSAAALPRGASCDSETGTVTWVPDSHQLGEHKIAIKVSDGTFDKTINFKVTVYRGVGSGNSSDTVSGNTGSQTDNGNNDSSTESGTGAESGGGGSSGGGAGGGGGSGGGASSGGDTSGDTTAGDNTDVGDSVPAERFIDLGGHTWAKEAIYYLVDLGVVNGTSHNTYSPAANIKRADFAIMLVRAFGITEGEGENFADVDASKYYAEELRLAKSAGIVNGIGENKFNPEGEITRQDMMLMLVRALEVQGKKLSAADASVLSQFTDAAQISDYAKDAVSRVVKDGIISGANGRLNPLSCATRAEIAVMLNRIYTSEKIF